MATTTLFRVSVRTTGGNRVEVVKAKDSDTAESEAERVVQFRFHKPVIVTDTVAVAIS